MSLSLPRHRLHGVKLWGGQPQELGLCFKAELSFAYLFCWCSFFLQNKIKRPLEKAPSLVKKQAPFV